MSFICVLNNRSDHYYRCTLYRSDSTGQTASCDKKAGFSGFCLNRLRCAAFTHRAKNNLFSSCNHSAVWVLRLQLEQRRLCFTWPKSLTVINVSNSEESSPITLVLFSSEHFYAHTQCCCPANTNNSSNISDWLRLNQKDITDICCLTSNLSSGISSPA